MADGLVLPLIVNIKGTSAVAALMNKKSFSKSLECKKLWIVHPETNRVLPWPGETEYLSLEKKEGFYSAELPAGSENSGFKLNKAIKIETSIVEELIRISVILIIAIRFLALFEMLLPKPELEIIFIPSKKYSNDKGPD